MATTTPAKAEIAAASQDAPASAGSNATPGPDASGEHVDSNGRQRKRRLDVNPSLILSEGRSKRRKTPSPEPEDGHDEHDAGAGGNDPKDPVRAKKLGYEIYNQIMSERSKEGDSLAEPFVKLPNKRAFPDYYETIKLPMSLEIVKQRLDDGSYDTLKAVVGDLGQIFTNAKRYNIKESVIFQYAKKLHKITRTFYTESTQPEPAPQALQPKTEEPMIRAASSMEPSDSRGGQADAAGPSGASADGGEGEASGSGTATSGRFRKRGSYMKDGPTVYKLVKPILKAIKDASARDGSGRQIAGIFMELPDRRIFTDYYRTIKQPISLKEIEDRMMARLYEHYQEFYDEVNLMCTNAMAYNEDGSEVYQDALQIQGILESYRPAIQEKIARPNERIRIKPTNLTPSHPGEAAYGQRQQYPHSPSPAMYASQSPQPSSLAAAGMHSAPYGSIPTPTPGPPGNFLPALPKGVVTEEIVASLDRYPAYEQSAWANSLPPTSVQVYRQLLVANDAKKRGLTMPNTQPVLSDLPSAGRPNGVSTLPDRLAPPHPTIKHLDFAFSTAGQADRSKAIRLHNMRGVVTHAVVLSSDTSELELTAYIADTKSSTSSATATDTGTTPNPIEAVEVVPEVSLRVNGNPGSLPKFVHSTPENTKPTGMRWTIAVPVGRYETKIEVVATKPGALAETSVIYVSRQ